MREMKGLGSVENGDFLGGRERGAGGVELKGMGVSAAINGTLAE